MLILTYNNKEYVIKYKTSKDYDLNVDYLKNKYTADVAFANDTTIFFGEELQSLDFEEILFKDLATEKVVEHIVNLYNNYIRNIDNDLINIMIKSIQYHKPDETEETIKEHIKNYINTKPDEVQINVGTKTRRSKNSSRVRN